MSVAMTVAAVAALQPPSLEKMRAPLEAKSTDNRRDSGYNSKSVSPHAPASQSTRGSCVGANTSIDSNEARLVPPALAPLPDLAEFDKTVHDATVSRFNLVQALIEEPLLAYIRRKLPGKKYRPIVVRLVVLGRSEDDAKPCIVVLCRKQLSKIVRKFFNQDSIMSLYRPEDDTVPSFEVVVEGRPPQTKQGDEDVDVLVPIIGGNEGYTTETYCGAPIIIRQPSGVEQMSTFGGIIKAVLPNGDTKLYGLTVGHVLLDSDSDAESSDDWGLQISDSESEASSDDSAEEEPKDETRPSQVTDEIQFDSTDAISSWTSLELGMLGSISKGLATANAKDGEPQAYYDWALIDMLAYKPNRIRPRKPSDGGAHEDGSFNSGDLVMPAESSSYTGKRQTVLVMSGSDGLKRGSLSALPSRLILGPGKGFVNTLVLHLDDHKQILDGDSGSWVVNERTLEVYGYVVAADDFGGAYVIPIIEALRDIKDTLGLQSIDLASKMDMATAKISHMLDTNYEPAATMALTDSPVLSRSATHSDAGNETKNKGNATIAEDVNPSEIVLPMSTNDLDEINVPGLVVYSDEEDEEEEQETGEDTSGLLTPAMLQLNTSDFGGRKRSNPLPTLGTSHYRSTPKRAKEPVSLEENAVEEEQEVKDTVKKGDVKEGRIKDKPKYVEQSKPREEPPSTAITSQNKRLSTVVTNAGLTAARRGSRDNQVDEDGTVYGKAEIMISPRVSVARSTSPTQSDTGGQSSFIRRSSGGTSLSNSTSTTVRVLIRRLSTNTSEESLRLMVYWSKELADVELLPAEQSEDAGFRSALLRFRTMAGAREAKHMLDGRFNISNDAEIIVEILSNDPVSARLYPTDAVSANPIESMFPFMSGQSYHGYQDQPPHQGFDSHQYHQQSAQNYDPRLCLLQQYQVFSLPQYQHQNQQYYGQPPGRDGGQIDLANWQGSVLDDWPNSEEAKYHPRGIEIDTSRTNEFVDETQTGLGGSKKRPSSKSRKTKGDRRREAIDKIAEFNNNFYTAVTQPTRKTSGMDITAHRAIQTQASTTEASTEGKSLDSFEKQDSIA